MVVNKLGRVSGYTLVEVMIAISVLGLVSAVSIPMFGRIKMSANEGGARKALTAYRNAIINFQTESSGFEQFTGLDNLVGYIEDSLAPQQVGTAGQKNGYTFSYEAGNGANQLYRIVARPAQPGITGEHIFILDQSGTVTEQIVAGLGGGGGASALPPTFPSMAVSSASFLNDLLNDPMLYSEKIKILAGMMESVGYYTERHYLFDAQDSRQYWSTPTDDIRSALLSIGESQTQAFDSLFEDTRQYLLDQNSGITIHKGYPENDAAQHHDQWFTAAKLLTQDDYTEFEGPNYGSNVMNADLKSGYQFVEIGFEVSAKPEVYTSYGHVRFDEESASSEYKTSFENYYQQRLS
jgi:prepilin-type N-terminal cleavage/methylation domain-containing protein